MCLILFALNTHEKYKLILAANRDEFFERPSKELHYWEENKNVMGGKDLVSGGTWLGLRSDGRFIAITNYRDKHYKDEHEYSRGEISRSFLLGNEPLDTFLNQVSSQRQRYSRFNLLISDDGCDTITYYSNVRDSSTTIKEGIHGLSNAFLDTPWPKVTKGVKYLENLIQSDTLNVPALMKLLSDDAPAPEKLLPDTGIPFDLEQKLSPVFISLKGYGTRCSTVLLIDRKNTATMHEVTYNENGDKTSEKSLSMSLKC